MTTTQEEESIAAEVLAASLGGAISASILYPLEVLKTKMQAETSSDDEDEENNNSNNNNKSSKSMVEYAENLYHRQGWFIFVKGMEFSALQSATEKALYFFAYTALKKMAVPVGGKQSISTPTNLLLGYIAEWAHLPITLPLDCWTTAIQTDTTGQHKNGMELLLMLLSEKGVKGMYKGIGAYVVLCLKPAIQYTVFEQLKSRLLAANSRQQRSLSAAQAFGLGMVARAISTILVFPYLRAKILMQTSSSSGNTTIMDVLKAMNTAELFRGLGPELTRGVLSSALMLMIKERIASMVQGMLLLKQ